MNKEIILLVKDNQSEAQFRIFASNKEEAYEKLKSTELNLDQFTVSEFKSGDKIFDFYAEYLTREFKEFNPNELLRLMINAARTVGDAEDTHFEADQVLCDALRAKFGYAIQVFDSIEKWYA